LKSYIAQVVYESETTRIDGRGEANAQIEEKKRANLLLDKQRANELFLSLHLSTLFKD